MGHIIFSLLANNYFLVVIIIALIFSLFLHRNLKEIQKGKKFEHEDKVI